MKIKENVDLWVNQLLMIEYEDFRVYYSNIISEDEDVVYIQLPQDKNFIPVQRVNGKVNVYMYNEKKEMIGFPSYIQEDDKKIKLVKPDIDSVRKVQRRNYFRVLAPLTIAIEVSPGETQKFVTDDISGGGLAFINNQSDLFKVGDELTGIVTLDNGSSSKAVPFKGRVVGIRPELRNKLRVAVEFIEMKEPVRAEIIRYCYRRQFEIRDRSGELMVGTY